MGRERGFDRAAQVVSHKFYRDVLRDLAKAHRRQCRNRKFAADGSGRSPGSG